MGIELASCSIVHRRRVRLVFTENVHASAFTTLSFYGATSVNSVGPSPAIVAAFALGASPNVVELQLSVDLAEGGIYEFTAVGVPNVGSSSTTPGGSLAMASFGETRAHPVASAGAITFTDAWLYGIDLLYSDVDFVETAGGDLEEVSGPALVRRDLEGRVTSEGLPWEPSFGLHPRSYVDGTPGALPNLRGQAIAQMLEDDRVKSCEATLGAETDTGDGYIEIAPKLIGDPLVSEVAPFRVTTTA